MSDINNALSANYLLVSATINKWSGRKTDTKASNEIIQGAHAVSNAGRFVKDALAGANVELKAASSALDAVRGFIYMNTLPYSTSTTGVMSGGRLLPTQRSMEFIPQVEALIVTANERVDDFVNVYDARVQQAITNLGTLANPDDYPTKEGVRQAFGIQVGYDPVPATSDYSRLAIPADLVDKFAQSMVEKEKVIMHNALGDLRKRLLTELERVAKNLAKSWEQSETDGRRAGLSKNLISNVQGLTNILADASFAKNPQLDKLIGAIKTHILSTTVEKLRASPSHAKDVSEKAEKIVDAVNAIEWF